MHTNNGIHTWNNRRGGTTQISSKLDNFLIIETLMLRNEELFTSILPAAGLDHWRIILQWQVGDTAKRKPFRFEKFWFLQLEFQEKLEEWWEEIPISRGTKMYQF